MAVGTSRKQKELKKIRNKFIISTARSSHCGKNVNLERGGGENVIPASHQNLDHLK